jgi:hypothetical protein
VTRLSSILAFVMMLACGLALGVWITARVLDTASAPGTLRYGAWMLWPKAGAPDADPYSLALFSRRGDVPMSPAEGLALFASQDSSGAALNGRCNYVIEGLLSPARAWTLNLYHPDGRLLVGPSGRSGFTSADALVDGAMVRIFLSTQPQPGNWLPLTSGDNPVIALRLYETPLSAVASALDGSRLPNVRRTGCNP